MSSSGTDVEAQFRLRMFALLGSPPALHQLLCSRSAPSSSSRLDLARFLAGYYLGFDFGRLFRRLNRATSSSTNSNILPNLLVWAEQDEEDQKEEQYSPNVSTGRSGWDRSQLAQLLPAQCSPSFTLRLLLREQRCLEAIFFADHFHDSRTSMALRFLADCVHPEINLFADYCHTVLMDNLLECIENGINVVEGQESDGVQRPIQRLIEAIVMADVLFSEKFDPSGFHLECLSVLANLMGAKFAKLLNNDGMHGDDPTRLPLPSPRTIRILAPMLPRPPIYCSPASLSPSPESVAGLDDPDTSAWLILHRCCTALVGLLARSNRLEQLVGFFALWLAEQQNAGGNGLADSEVPFLLEAQFFTAGDSDSELGAQLDAFQTLLSIVVGMEQRDTLIRMMHESDDNPRFGRDPEVPRASNERIARVNAKLSTLAAPFLEKDPPGREHQNDGGLVWPSLKRWAQMAEQSDIEIVSLFLHIIQQQNTQISRRFFPPLNKQNRSQWSSLLLSNASSGNESRTSMSWMGHMEVFVEEEQKFKLPGPDFVRLCFLARHFPSIPLDHSQVKIQMLLDLDPSEICATDQNTGQQRPNLSQIGTSKNWESSFKFAPKNEEEEVEEEDGLDVLITQIRESLKRLEEADMPEGQIAQESNSKMGQKGEEEYDDEGVGTNRRRDEEKKEEENEDEEAEHLKLIRRRIEAELIRKQIERNRNRREESMTASDEVPRSRSSGRTSRSWSRNRTRGRRRNKGKRESSSSSGVSGRTNSSKNGEGMTEEQELMREMEEIGKRLEWIRGHFERQNVKQTMEEEREEEIEEELGIEDEEEGPRTRKLGMANIEAQKEAGMEGQNDQIRDVEGTYGRDKVSEEEEESVGYHSSRPTTDAPNSSAEERTKILAKYQIESNIKMGPPPTVERMDFSGLRSSDEEDGGAGMVEEVEKKPKLWTEIEVFPRNNSQSSMNAAAPAPSSSSLSTSTKTIPKSNNGNSRRKRDDSSGGRRQVWRRPQWLRLLPPFDGTIRTERQAPIGPLLELKLDDIYATSPRGQSTGDGTRFRRQRTFLELAAKKEMEHQKGKMGPKKMEMSSRNSNQNMEKGQKRQKQEMSSTSSGMILPYDSGIGLDQQQQQMKEQRKKRTTVAETGGGVVLYSAELDEAEIEEMRRRAEL